MDIAVIGGSGFIGSSLINELNLIGNNQILCIDKKKPDVKCRFIQTDLSNKMILVEALRNIDVVYHKASILGSPNMSMDCTYSEMYIEQNIIGLNNVVEACLSNRVKKIIFDSSVSVYGEEWQAKVAKENIFPKPRNFYGFSKVASERLLYKTSKTSDLNIIILRYSRVRNFQSHDVLFSFIMAILEGRPIKIQGNCNKEIEFVDISDVLKANISALEKNIKFGVFNISSGDKASILNIANLCALALNKGSWEIEIDEASNKTIDIEPLTTAMDMKLAKEILGYIPFYNLFSMITQACNYNRSLLDNFEK